MGLTDIDWPQRPKRISLKIFFVGMKKYHFGLSPDDTDMFYDFRDRPFC